MADSTKETNITKCFTFYSYKGGSGRSTTLLNTAKHLIAELNVSPQNPMLIVDADLESAGLTYFFNMDLKFTCKFQQSINTATLIFQNGSYFSDNTADMAFGTSEPMMRYPVSASLAKKFEQAAQGQYVIDKLFADVNINSNEKLLLTAMTETYIKFIGANSASNGNPDYDTLRNYNIAELFAILHRIETDGTLSAKEKAQRKEKAICDFLPAQQFADISDYFDAPEGSVKFLGADIKSKDIVPHGSDLPSYIKKLILQCTYRNYAAVLFDSGAGTQSTPHALHRASDVIVYCLRPSKQFTKGTMVQLINTQNAVTAVAKTLNKQGTDKKMIILLPTAIAETDADTGVLCDASFKEIEKIASSFPNIVDKTFCSKEKGLNEVNLFKWREVVLGTSLTKQCSPEEAEILHAYTRENTMPADAKKAYNTYRQLAKRIVYNAGLSKDEIR